MAKSVNKVILLGNLGADPELRATQGGSSVANLRLATTDSWKDKSTGELQERTEWHRVVLFGNLADIAGRFLGKGSRVYIEGSLQTRKWTDKDGVEKYTTEVVGRDITLLDGIAGAKQPDQAPARRPAAPAQDNLGWNDDVPF